jgi:DNA polymerase-4
MGVVLSASYEARACGVRTAMGGGEARRRCPEAVFVSPRFDAYVEASRAVFAIFEGVAPAVEALSIDEAFLDVRGLEHISGTPVEIAQALRVRVRTDVGLPITIGIARTKFLAKVASRVAKPDGLLVVEPGEELDFLHPLPVERLWGVGEVTARKLRARGITTVGEVAATPEAALVELLGRASGRHLNGLALGRDPRPVKHRARRRSIGAQRALGRRPRPPDEVRSILIALVDRVCRRLRKADRLCRTVVLRLRFGDYERATRSHTLARATASTAALQGAATSLLEAAEPTIRHRGLTLIGVALTGLVDERAEQMALPFDQRRELDAALDRVAERFGSSAVTRASRLGAGEDLTVPLLPD